MLDHKKSCSFHLWLLVHSLSVLGILSFGSQLPWKESSYPDTNITRSTSVDNEIPCEEANEHSGVREVDTSTPTTPADAVWIRDKQPWQAIP